MENDLVYKRKFSKYSSHEQLLKMISERENAIALDLGSSDGILTNSLLEKNIKSICVDLVDPKLVKAQCEKYYQINLENYEQLKFDQKFDYIILADTIEHIRNATELMMHLKQFLKADGKVIVSVPNVAIWVYRLLILLGKFDYTEKGTLDKTHIHFYTLKTVTTMLKKCGYTINKMKPTSLPFEVVFPALQKSFILRSIDNLYYLAAKLWPSMFAYQFVLECHLPDKKES